MEAQTGGLKYRKSKYAIISSTTSSSSSIGTATLVGFGLLNYR